MIQLLLLVMLGVLVVLVARQARSVFTTRTTGFPTGRLVVVFAACLVAGVAFALVVAFLVSLALPHGLYQLGRVFLGLGLIAALLLYDKAKARVLEASLHDS